jgi:hypothetical protein
MPEDSIDYLNSQGQNLLKTYDTYYDVKSFQVNLETMNVEPTIIVGTTPKPPFQALKSAIKNELQRTDYTQTIDATNHLTNEMINAYAEYRVILRTALEQPDYDSMALSLPGFDPTGKDYFVVFKGLVSPPPPANVSNVVINVVYTNQ